MVNKICFTT